MISDAGNDHAEKRSDGHDMMIIEDYENLMSTLKMTSWERMIINIRNNGNNAVAGDVFIA